LPAFIRYDCLKKAFVEINPDENPDDIIDPKDFDDDWSEPLDREEFGKIDAYFRSISHLQVKFDFLNFRVGGEDNRIEFRKRNFRKGLTFEVPHNSLMQAIEFEIFDDLLIGNFMKTILEGKWPHTHTGLYPDFTPYVGKYADNGRAKSDDELEAYFREYQRRSTLDYLRHRMKCRVIESLRPYVKANPVLYQFARRTCWWS